MKKIFTLLIAFIASIGTIRAGISITDNSIEDWNTIPAAQVFELSCPADATLIGLKSIKVYCDSMYIYILMEPNMSVITDLEQVPFHVYINVDNNNETGGYGDLFTDANTDILLEGLIFDNNQPKSYNPAVFKWWGPVGGNGWHWSDPNVDHDGSDNWGAIIGEDQMNVGASQYINGKFEIRLLKELISQNLTDDFGLGFEIQNHWSPAGVLPLVSPSNNNRNGYTNKIRVWWKSVKEGDLSFQIDRGNHSASICSSNCLDTINIPSDISIEGETYIVTSIGNSAFSGCESLTTINIPEGIINIGMDAFRGCTNLTNITFPSSISNIGKFAFYGCTNLISPIYNSSMFIYLPTTHIGAYTIPENIENIAGSAFSGCTNLINITIPSSVKSIGVGAFDSCLNLTTIKWHAQSCCDMLSCPFSNSVSSINIADGVEHIPAHLCDGLTEITSIIIPSSVRTIGDYAFANINNRKISNLVLPSEIISIGDYAFAEDTYIEQIDFGKNIEYIGAYAFHNCSRVLSMSCLAEVTPDVATNALSSISSNADLYILSSALKKYQVDSNWNRFLLKPLGATETATDSVNIEPGDNTATFTWPTNSDAASYTIEITKDGEVFCTLIFNANGQLTGIAFAPSANGQSHAPSAILTANGMQFTVTGLDVATNYAFSLTTKDSEGVVIASYSGTFGTTGAPQGIDNPSANLDGYQKLLRNGQILILRADKTYTLTGQEIK